MKKEKKPFSRLTVLSTAPSLCQNRSGSPISPFSRRTAPPALVAKCCRSAPSTPPRTALSANCEPSTPPPSSSEIPLPSSSENRAHLRHLIRAQLRHLDLSVNYEPSTPPPNPLRLIFPSISGNKPGKLVV